jgi:RHS repeat-associated protein
MPSCLRADGATGLDCYHARSYDPAGAQFASADTAGAAGLNRYGYVGGNPTTARDPSGHMLLMGDTGGDVGAPALPAPTTHCSDGMVSGSASNQGAQLAVIHKDGTVDPVPSQPTVSRQQRGANGPIALVAMTRLVPADFVQCLGTCMILVSLDPDLQVKCRECFEVLHDIVTSGLAEPLILALVTLALLRSPCKDCAARSARQGKDLRDCVWTCLRGRNPPQTTQPTPQLPPGVVPYQPNPTSPPSWWPGWFPWFDPIPVPKLAPVI